MSNGSSDLLTFVKWVPRSAELCLAREKATTYQLFANFIPKFDGTNEKLKTFFVFFPRGRPKTYPTSDGKQK